MARKNDVQGPVVSLDIDGEIRMQLALLGHDGLGVAELRVFERHARVAYADSAEAVVRLCRQMDGKVSVYIGVQARPARLFDLAPNRWVLAHGGPEGNCAHDEDLEWISVFFFDIDVVSALRQKGHPASTEELQETLRAARLLARQEGLALSSGIGCSGNGHYVLAPIVPVPVDREEIARKFRTLCRQLADNVAGQCEGVRVDPVYNLSRVMRVMGTVNCKGQPVPGRPHRRACFVTEPPLGRSFPLHHMILNAEVQEVMRTAQPMSKGLKCDLARIEKCQFIRWCRRYPQEVSEPQWFALISNLAHLEGGIGLIHAISALDGGRYDHADTNRMIERILREGYKPTACRMIVSPAMARPGRGVFQCSQIRTCPAKAPMYMAAIRAIRQQ